MRTVFLALLAGATILPVSPAAASGPGFDPRVITFGETREQLKNTPMVNRPYRPLHFYGNSVRRRHSRSLEAGRPATTQQ